MLPARNKRDLDEVPVEAKANLNFVWLETVDDALKVAVGAKAAPVVENAAEAAEAI